MPAELTCQMKSLIRGIIAEGRVRPGAIFWTTESRAKQYIRDRVAEPIGAAVDPAGYHPAETPEKKLSSVAPDGRSTDSAGSSAPGATLGFIASLPARASIALKSRRSKAPKSAEPASSSSTTPT